MRFTRTQILFYMFHYNFRIMYFPWLQYVEKTHVNPLFTFYSNKKRNVSSNPTIILFIYGNFRFHFVPSHYEMWHILWNGFWKKKPNRYHFTMRYLFEPPQRYRSISRLTFQSAHKNTHKIPSKVLYGSIYTYTLIRAVTE